MIDEMMERCRRICGDGHDRCFIGNKRQLNCIADMVINKVSGIIGIIDAAKGMESGGNAIDTLDMATEDLEALVYWVRYLQVVQDLREISARAAVDKGRRRENRYPFPDEYRKYIRMTMIRGDEPEPVALLDFSRHGIRFRVADTVEEGAEFECSLNAPYSIAGETSFRVRVVHCIETGDGYAVGGEINAIADEASFEVFRKLYDFIVKSYSAGERG
ncbi:MAG: PilZ domain-containing protein [Nitrospirae bacterium]|nr:PilZ domain-containing protein [Nitrospirota bacterium]